MMAHRIAKLAVSIFMVVTTPASRAETPIPWEKSPVTRTLPGVVTTAQTFFSPVLGTKQGEFKAMYESMLDKRETASGTFLLARFRVVEAQATGGGHPVYDPKHDTYEQTVMVDCARHFSDTVQESFYLNSKLVAHRDVPDADIIMNQDLTPNTTIDDLCKHLKSKNAW